MLAKQVSKSGEFNRVLGIFNFEREERTSAYLEGLLQKREEARKAKDWALADQMRQEIISNGYVIEDTAHGPRLKKS